MSCDFEAYIPDSEVALRALIFRCRDNVVYQSNAAFIQ
jgi:hypothetical protein